MNESGSESSRLSALALSATILVGILMFHTSMSLLTHWGRRFLNARLMRAVSVIAGIALLGFGIRFAYLGWMALLK